MNKKNKLEKRWERLHENVPNKNLGEWARQLMKNLGL
jgi:hypothetical protein